VQQRGRAGRPVRRREINWDGVPSPPIPIHSRRLLPRPRAAIDTPGTGFEVSAKAGNPTATPVRFNNPEFQAFSQERLFAPVGSNTYDSHFFVPGTGTQATTSAFGVVFTDVDVTGSAKIEYFDSAGALLDTVVAPASLNGGLSFAGESFNAGERVARVRVTSGTTTTLTSDPAGQDAVAQDDFIYGEPLPGLIAFRLDAERVDEDAGTAALTVTRQGAAGPATGPRPPTAAPRQARTTPRRPARSPSGRARRPSRSRSPSAPTRPTRTTRRSASR
jgi:hypothetical protein